MLFDFYISEHDQPITPDPAGV